MYKTQQNSRTQILDDCVFVFKKHRMRENKKGERIVNLIKKTTIKENTENGQPAVITTGTNK